MALGPGREEESRLCWCGAKKGVAGEATLRMPRPYMAGGAGVRTRRRLVGSGDWGPWVKEGRLLRGEASRAAVDLKPAGGGRREGEGV